EAGEQGRRHRGGPHPRRGPARGARRQGRALPPALRVTVARLAMVMDPIELEVMKHVLQAVPLEMGEALARSAFSPNIRERRDLSCAVFSEKGELVAQAAHIPV